MHAGSESVVLGGVIGLGSDAKVVRWPERYSDKRDEVMWTTVMRLADALPTTGGPALRRSERPESSSNML
jgi:hypothetical protein